MGRKRGIGSRLDAQISLRLPAELKRQVDDAARMSGRSKNAEMIMRLEDSFAPPDGPGSQLELSMKDGFDQVRRELSDVRRELARTQEMLHKK